MHYVIMEMANEYNDEVYSLLDSGIPVTVFTNKEEANACCRKKQLEALRGLEVGGYAYDPEDLTGDRNLSYYQRKRMSEEEIISALPFCDFIAGDFNSWVIPETLTDEQLTQVNNVFKGLQFFKVIVVK